MIRVFCEGTRGKPHLRVWLANYVKSTDPDAGVLLDPDAADVGEGAWYAASMQRTRRAQKRNANAAEVATGSPFVRALRGRIAEGRLPERREVRWDNLDEGDQLAEGPYVRVADWVPGRTMSRRVFTVRCDRCRLPVELRGEKLARVLEQLQDHGDAFDLRFLREAETRQK
jgi:hypothetical protein